VAGIPSNARVNSESWIATSGCVTCAINPLVAKPRSAKAKGKAFPNRVTK
jgi:hypothetical protein